MRNSRPLFKIMSAQNVFTVLATELNGHSCHKTTNRAPGFESQVSKFLDWDHRLIVAFIVHSFLTKRLFHGVQASNQIEGEIHGWLFLLKC